MAILAALVLWHWNAVRDHVVGWSLILTETLEAIPPRMPRELDAAVLPPQPVLGGMRVHGEEAESVRDVLESLATHADCPVMSTSESGVWDAPVMPGGWQSDLEVLVSGGWRILELELPRVIVARPPDR